MLIFGPYRCIPKDIPFIIFNLSSPVQEVPRLPGLLVDINSPIYDEKQFDLWYYEYVLNDPVACSSLMQILSSLYDGNNVYICIADYTSDYYISMMNESFMKILQQRYDIKYSIINDPEDYEYIDHDGCDFMSVYGISNFDEDRKRYMLLNVEENIERNGGAI